MNRDLQKFHTFYAVILPVTYVGSFNTENCKKYTRRNVGTYVLYNLSTFNRTSLYFELEEYVEKFG